eukprot:TRINITY_DN9530_c0_g1_i1.p1 TRINITY_DN9530_c0_g1~~TRINITY_DN9530_c0_g1_i1.p1  ORF type:complete len:533 (+),score=92.41 TRINITY_DN9530_c0_g1_i1:105-1601(+)
MTNRPSFGVSATSVAKRKSFGKRPMAKGSRSFGIPRSKPACGLTKGRANPFKSTGQKALTMTKVYTELVSQSLILITVSEGSFSDEVLDILRDYVSFDKLKKKCELPASLYHTVADRLRDMDYVSFNDLPLIVEKIFVSKEVNFFSKDVGGLDLSSKLTENIVKCMYPYQEEGIRFGIQLNGRLLIGDVMGLGKTLQSIALAIYYKNDWPLLIVCPSSVQSQWRNELINWIGDDFEVDIEFVNTNSVFEKCNDPSRRIFIVSYDVVTRRKNLDNIFGDCLIIDESHYIKTKSAKRTKAIVPLIQSCKRAILLTGTASLSRPMEIFSQVNSLLPSVYSNQLAFEYRYCGEDGIDNARHLKELHLLLINTVMLRRTKKVLTKFLPSKIREIIYLQNEDAEETIKESLPKIDDTTPQMGEVTFSNDLSPEEMQVMLYGDTNFSSGGAPKMMQEYCQTGKRKASLLVKYIENYLEENTDDKVLFFAHHKFVLDAFSVVCVVV